MGSRVMRAGESNGVRYYKRLGEIAKLATTSRSVIPEGGGAGHPALVSWRGGECALLRRRLQMAA
jgi:hypothetical protein